jgi:hypothetical protein
MPKSPPIEYFEFTCRCPVLTAGPIMAQLSKIEELDVSAPHLVTEVRSFSRNTAATGSNPEMGTRAFLTEWSKANPTFKANDAVKALRADGRGGGTAAYPALNALVEDGTFKKLAPGQYSRADVKALPSPKKKAKKAPKLHDVSASDFTLRVMSRNHGKISSATLKRHFEEDGRVPSGTGPVLNRLRVDGMIKSLGEGMYELTARAGKKPAPKKATNGAATVETAPGV